MPSVLEPTVELWSITPNAQELIERCGRICWKSEDKICEGSADRFIKMLKSKRHASVLEHAVATFNVRTDRGLCYHPDTLVLTDRGWISFLDVVDDDKFATKNDNGKIVYMKGKLIKKHFCGHLLSFKSTQVDLLVTPNHNMWIFDYEKRSKKEKIWKFKAAEALVNGRYGFERGIKVDDSRKEKVTINGGTWVDRAGRVRSYKSFTGDGDKLFELIGWIMTYGGWSETSISGSGRRLYITQKKHSGISRIKSLLGDLGIHYSEKKNGKCGGLTISISCLALWFYLDKNSAPAGRKSFVVRIPRDMMMCGNACHLKALLSGIMGGDGTKRDGKGLSVVYSSSIGFAKDLCELAMLIGRSGSIRTIKPSDRRFPNGVLSKCRESYIVAVDKNPYCMLSRKCAKDFGKKIKYNGMVVCAELEKYHKLYVMHGGKPIWCGNSHEIVRHRIASYSQESTRYVNYGKKNGEIFVIKPSGMGEQESDEWWSAMEDAERHYLNLIKMGSPPQRARSVLPTCTKTEIAITMNFRSWMHFIDLRTSPAAHPDIIIIARAIQMILVERASTVFTEEPKS